MKKTKYILIITSISILLLILFKLPLACKLCGTAGISISMGEAISRKTFVSQYHSFKILTDSLTYIKLNDKIFFMEKKFLYGKNDASGTTIIENEGSPNYQLGVSPPQGSLLKSNHHLFFAGDFHQIPDTIRCEIWSYSNAGEKIRKIGDALIY